MLTELHENSIELWATEAEKLFNKDQQPLSDELGRFFFNCCAAEKKMEEDEHIREDLAKNKLGLSSVFYNRVRCCHTYEASLALCLFMGYASNTFGDVVIYTNYLQYKAHKHNVKRIDIEFLSVNVFPMGLPTRETLHKVWDMQKVERKEQFGSDNLLDYYECQKSIVLQ